MLVSWANQRQTVIQIAKLVLNTMDLAQRVWWWECVLSREFYSSIDQFSQEPPRDFIKLTAQIMQHYFQKMLAQTSNVNADIVISLPHLHNCIVRVLLLHLCLLPNPQEKMWDFLSAVHQLLSAIVLSLWVSKIFFLHSEQYGLV